MSDALNATRGNIIRLREKILERDSSSLVEMLKSSRFMNFEEYRQFTNRRMILAAKNAYIDSPYYQQLYNSTGIAFGENEDYQKQISLISKIPPITKQNLRENLSSVYSISYVGRNLLGRTSGSTGHRFIFMYDKYMPSYGLASGKFGRGWWGIPIGVPTLTVWGSYKNLQISTSERLKLLIKNCADKICGVYSSSAFEVSDQQCFEKINLINKKKIEVLYGYGTAILLLAEVINRYSLQEKVRSIHWVIYTSEYLGESQKEIIQSAFNSPVISEYGSVETGIIAYDCPCGSSHIMQQFLNVEVLSPDGRISPIGTGHAVITHYFAKKMPLVRYVLGDQIELIETKEPCINGFIGKSIKKIIGRNNDILVAPSGMVIHPEKFDYLMRTIEGIKRFQVHEVDTGKIKVFVEVEKECSHDKVKADLENYLKNQIGTEFTIEISIVDGIENNDYAKFRWVISKNR